MRVKKFVLFNEEATLTIADLDKPSNPKVTRYGPKRGDILIGKIKNGEKVHLKNGEDVVVDIDADIEDRRGKYASQKSDNLRVPGKITYDDVFTDKSDGDAYKLSDFIKTAEFSGGRGSSLGTVETRIIESIQVYILAFKQNMYLSTNLMVRDIESHEEDICLTKNAFTSIKVTPELLGKYDHYHLTFIKTANKFVGNNAILDSDTKYNFYQIGSGVGFTKLLGETYRKCCKNSFGKIINMSKWTPSDIWAVNSSMEKVMMEELSKIDNMSDLNIFIDRHFGEPREKRNIVGISLKKISSRQEHIMVVINKETERPEFELDSIILPKQDLTKGLKLKIKRISNKYPGYDTVSVRSNQSKIDNINVEIQGSSSRHGKCSLTQINHFLDTNGLEKVPLKTDLSQKSIKSLVSMIRGIESDLGANPQSSAAEKTKARLISKYQSLKLAQILMHDRIDGGSGCDDVINAIMHYALAIENQYFECPKYARVVEY